MMAGRWLPDLEKLKKLVEWIKENKLSVVEVFRILRWCKEIDKWVVLKLKAILEDLQEENEKMLRYLYYVWYFDMLSVERIEYWMRYIKDNALESYLIGEKLKELEDVYEVLVGKFGIPKPVVWLRWKMKWYRKTSLKRLLRWEIYYRLKVRRYLSEEIIEEGSRKTLVGVLWCEDDIRELEMIFDME